jgi:gliding motility-associated-like protein
MYKSFCFLCLFFTSLFLLPLGEAGRGFAQHPERNRANIWYFGNGAGLDFSSGSPVAITNGQLDSWESCASICDVNGNLLFYTDGDTVWDRNHNVMPNGTGLYGNCLPPGPNNSATQGVIIIPQPKSETIFYVFTVDCAENLGAKGMNYSIVDLSLNGGFGDVTLKNQFLFAPSTEGMAAAMNCSRDSIWVVGHDDNDLFYSYLVTKDGLSRTPAISITNTIFNLFGQMKFSPNNKKIAYQGYIYNFNFTNGTITNGQFINFDGYGLSFSPDSKKLYYSISGYFIGQFDITYNNVTDILNSFQTVYQGISNDGIYGLQIGIDSKLYVANIDTTKISTIDNPNNTGSSANFNPYSVDLNGRKSQFTFPSFIESYFDQNYSEANCQDEEVIITIPNAFSPNTDGINDFFSIKVAGYEKITYTIYNRWGSLIKTDEIFIENPSEQIIALWDATYKNKPVTDGVYFYVMQLTTFNGTQENKNGFIQIMR